MVTSEEVDIDRLAGWQAALSPVPHKHPYFAKIKSNNYLNNVLAQVEAQERGFNTVRAAEAGAADEAECAFCCWCCC